MEAPISWKVLSNVAAAAEDDGDHDDGGGGGDDGARTASVILLLPLSLSLSLSLSHVDGRRATVILLLSQAGCLIAFGERRRKSSVRREKS